MLLPQKFQNFKSFCFANDAIQCSVMKERIHHTFTCHDGKYHFFSWHKNTTATSAGNQGRAICNLVMESFRYTLQNWKVWLLSFMNTVNIAHISIFKVCPRDVNSISIKNLQLFLHNYICIFSPYWIFKHSVSISTFFIKIRNWLFSLYWSDLFHYIEILSKIFLLWDEIALLLGNLLSKSVPELNPCVPHLHKSHQIISPGSHIYITWNLSTYIIQKKLLGNSKVWV